MKRSHINHYIVLAVILVCGISAFIYTSPDNRTQMAVGIITSAAYVVWGLIHHAVQKDLHMRIVIEYILIGAIAIVLLATMMQGA